MPYILSTDFNGIDLLRKDGSVARCQTCNQPTAKWKEAIDTRRKIKIDFSHSRDGFRIASEKLKRIFEANGLYGCDFLPLSSGDFVMMPTRIVDFDFDQIPIVEQRACLDCGQYLKFKFNWYKTVIAKNEPPIGEKEIVRSRLEYPMIDGCDFDILIGKRVVDVLKANRIQRFVAHLIS